MEKKKLAADQLRVDSYPTGAPEPPRGTVLGAAATLPNCAGTVAVVGSCYNGCTMDLCEG
jgi:hypothetical protein